MARDATRVRLRKNHRHGICGAVGAGARRGLAGGNDDRIAAATGRRGRNSPAWPRARYRVQKRPIALVSPQQLPNAQGYAYVGIDPDKLMWLKTAKSSDALWGAEQILRTGSCGALVLWQQHISAESLGRLLLAAQIHWTAFVI